jgi:aminopeptidase N
MLLACLLQGCHYSPFLKYRSTKGDDNFPKFREKHLYKGSPMPLRTAYDVTCYDWSVEVNPKRKLLEGTMRINFKATAPADSILLDMQGRLKVTAIEGSTSVKKYRHKGDLLYILFDQPLQPGVDYRIDIGYKGKPASIIGYGPVFWMEDRDSNPRVSTLTQGIGPHWIMPCKDLLYDEPDSCHIRVTVPEGLTAVANGLLRSTSHSDGKSTFQYSVANPINVYNISFNVGKFCTLEFPYTDLSGNDRVIEAAVLCEDSTAARAFYAQSPAVMREFEHLYGPFPWWDDACRFVQSAVKGGAMEHQSAISMGDILTNDIQPDSAMHSNTTLIHELAHEWWGNSITAVDYGDAWLHEGMATYSEALVLERLYGPEAYMRAMSKGYSQNYNERPVIKPFGVRYNSWANSRDFNIYGKGSLFMHTLRMQLADDSLFFETLHSASQHFAKSNISTSDFEAYFNSNTGRDWSTYFDVYLRSNTLPTLLVHFDKEASTFYYKWDEGLTDAFSFRVDIAFGEQEVAIVPGLDWQAIKDAPPGERTIARLRAGYFDVRKVGPPAELPSQ